MVFLFGRGVLGLHSGRLLEPVVEHIPLCRRSGGCPGGNSLYPPHDVRFLQPALRLQQVGDFDHCAMDDRIGDGGAEQGGLELPRFSEIVGPFAARLWESEVGARRHDPGRLEHRGDL